MIAARLITFLLVVHYAGARLANFLVYRYMTEMPDWMHQTIRVVLDNTGNADIREPDDLSGIALLSTLVACWIAVAIALIVFYKISRQLVHRYARTLR
ncbi:hypothetical protein AWB80_04711 [Caballeronia pedi]|uniref:Uncharacterized protein n=1 Tax=Caballeronia pedi TaxID=1777141 RepID=A0A158C6W5_9BURK|nr:hypothetical protein [Caballeronia pedi]SAK78085.1 hypothetical protein AWB80_04711 [Caballeronia pedi]